MRTSKKISLLLLTVLGAFFLAAAEEFSRESMEFLSVRSAGVQEGTAQAVRAALNGTLRL
ncbi:hypothetical protein [uncultured Victivallis sp.]|uniref:hypothetical protein n=1 Tax=uncultured Victivallis sp. TaxID=354118 RepID=UPI0025E1C889|nr:hypothetical protein [uncultured Victivallis sp.]